LVVNSPQKALKGRDNPEPLIAEKQ